MSRTVSALRDSAPQGVATQALLVAPSGDARPDDAQRAMLLFASALAGQPLAWMSATASTPEFNHAMRRHGAAGLLRPASTRHRADGDGIGLGRRAHRLEVLRQVIAHQPGGCWSLDAASLSVPDLQGPCGERVPPDTLARCLASWPRPILLRRLFHAIEAARVDAVLGQQFPGARADLAAAQGAGPPRSFWAARMAAWANATVPCTGTDGRTDGRTEGKTYVTAVDSLRAAIGLLNALCADGRHRRRGLALNNGLLVSDAAAAPKANLKNGRPASGQGQAVGMDPNGASDSDNAADDAARHHNQAAADLSPGLRPDVKPGSARTRAHATDPSRTARASVGIDAAVNAHTGHPGHARVPGLQTQWHDEWDCNLNQYRRGWTCVHLRPVKGIASDFLAELHARHAPLLRAIRRQFAAAPPTARARGGPAADGDQIDIDQALAGWIERRAGGHGADWPHRHRPRSQRDVCTAVLLDMSGSTAFAAPPPRDASLQNTQAGMASAAGTADDDDGLLYGFRARGAVPLPPARRVIDIAHDAIALMCDGMQLLGDRHAIYGFSGHGRWQVDVRVAKAFDEPWSARSAAALASLQPQGSTRTGAAIRCALSQLLLQPAQTHVLMVVTDGYPQDLDYGPTPTEPRYGLHDTAQALREAARAGVAAFCLSVDRAAHDYLRTMCPSHRYLVIDDVHALPQQLSRAYRRLTAV